MKENEIIDAHIHLDQYNDNEFLDFMEKARAVHCKRLIAVGSNLLSCKRTLELSRRYEEVIPAFGFHPEQKLPETEEMDELFSFMTKNINEICAIGEVGLPTYLKLDDPNLNLFPYIEILNRFLHFGLKWDKPIALHAVYNEAETVCDLLVEKNIKKAHFHWFKGNMSTMKRMANRGYMISVTPEVVYREKIQEIAQYYPLELFMVETDGPWPFLDRFVGRRTHPEMIHESIQTIAHLKRMNVDYVYNQIYKNTEAFYSI